MFQNRKKTRTQKHNLQIAMLLSLVAGFINVAGFISIGVLTTNITGHFAFMVNDVVDSHFTEGLIYGFYVLSFLLGAFSANFLVELMFIKNERFIYSVPLGLEILLISIVAFFGYDLEHAYQTWIAVVLLFAMGMQNSLVTKISKAVVRTTHLTGLFTDLGIELSQLFFVKSLENRLKLKSTILLRLTIIIFFFLGGIFAGFIFPVLHFKSLYLMALLLALALIYDNLKYTFLKWKLSFRKHYLRKQ